MQIRINDSMYFKSSYSDYMLYLFQNTSTETFPQQIRVPNEAWFEYIDMIYTYTGHSIPEKVISETLEEIDVDNSSDGVMVAFSGGVVSAAYAKYFQSMGSDVVLYNMTRLNRSYGKERDAAKEASKHLNIELITQEMKYYGRMNGIESPVKNHLIYAFMIPEMVHRGMIKCSGGTFPTDTLNTIGNLSGVSDAYDLLKAFERAIKRTFPKYSIVTAFKNWTHAFAYICEADFDLISKCQSCLLPDMYREKIRRINHEKYKLEIMNNRCLSCWKCCREYLALGMLGYIEMDKNLLVNQVIPTLRRFYVKDRGFISNLSVEKIISNFVSLVDIQRYKSDSSLIMKDFT